MPKFQYKTSQGTFVIDSNRQLTPDELSSVISKQDIQQSSRSNLLTDPVQTLKRSGGEFVSGIAQAAAHPGQTLKALGGLASGIVQKAIPGEQENEKFANALGEIVKNRYGSLENFKNTVLEDPVGFLSDASILLTGGGAAVSKLGQVSKIGQVAKTGQRISQIGRSVDPLGATIRSVGTGLRNVTQGRKIAPFAGKLDKPAIEAGRKLGIDLPASAKTTSMPVALTESFVSKGPFGERMSNKIENVYNQMVKISDDAIAKTGSASDLGSAGEAISRGADKFRERFFNVKEILYDRADFISKARNIVVKPKESLEFVNEILMNKRSAYKVLGSASDIRYFGFLKNKLQRTTVKANEIRAAIQELNKKIGNINDPVATGNKAELGKIATLLSNELDNAVVIQAPELAQDIGRANKFYKLGLNELNSHFGKKIFALKEQPDKILPAIINKSTSGNDIKRIYRLIGRENVPSVQSAFLEQFFLGAKNPQGLFTPNGISNQITKFGRDKLNRILTPEQVEKISNLDTVAKAMGRSGKITGGSQTAFLSRLAIELGPLFVNPAASLKLIAADLAASRFISSPTGQRFLSTGVPLTGRTGQRAIDLSGKFGTGGRLLRIGEISNRGERQ